MKYLKREYISLVNSRDPVERQLGNDYWDAGARAYKHYFDLIKGKLPKSFLDHYLAHEGYHDYTITKIEIINYNNHQPSYNSSKIVLTLRDEFRVIHDGVRGFEIIVPPDTGWFEGTMQWGYSEFELKEKKLWEHRLACEMDAEIHIEFKDIYIEPIE